jgi:hypothetical protein
MYNRRRPTTPYNPNFKKEYSHSETQSQLDDETKVHISKDGRVIITQGNATEYDEVNLSAAQVYRISSLLNETKDVKFVPRVPKNE